MQVVLAEVQRETAKLKMMLNGEGEAEADKENAAGAHRAVFVSRLVWNSVVIRYCDIDRV